MAAFTALLGQPSIELERISDFSAKKRLQPGRFAEEGDRPDWRRGRRVERTVARRQRPVNGEVRIVKSSRKSRQCPPTVACSTHEDHPAVGPLFGNVTHIMSERV